MPNSRHSGAICSPSSSRAMNFSRSSIGLHAFQGILRSPQKAPLCNPCLRNELSPLSQEGHFTELLLQAVPHEIPPLRADDLLVDRLLQAVETRLRPAQLHLVLPLLTLQSLHRGLTGKQLALGNGSGGRIVGLHAWRRCRGWR